MAKLPDQVSLPKPRNDWEKLLIKTLNDYLNVNSQIVTGLETGRRVSFINEQSVVPTGGSFGWGDFVPKKEPVPSATVSVTPVQFGWLCTSPGSASTDSFTPVYYNGGSQTTVIISGSGTVAGGGFSSGNVATQTEVLSASANNVLITPFNMIDHPAFPKAWAYFDGRGVLSAGPIIFDSYGISAINFLTAATASLTGTGSYKIDFSREFANADYNVMVTCGTDNAGLPNTVIATAEDQFSASYQFTLVMTSACAGGTLNYCRVGTAEIHVAVWGRLKIPHT